MHEVLSSVSIGSGVTLARVVRAGRWIFAQGNMATVHNGGICVDTPPKGQDALLCEPPGLSQGEWVFDALAKCLGKTGASLEDLVRLDQYYDTPKSVYPYHLARQAALTTIIPPSTSIIVESLLTPAATLCLEALAVVDGRNKRQAVNVSGIPMPRASSCFAPVLKLDEYIFVAGQVADALDGSGIAPQATMNPEYNWDGSEISRQAQYVLDNLIRTVEAVGSDREHIVKAQVYLRSMYDLPEFDEIWRRTFGDTGPVRTVAPASALALKRGIVEINLICVVHGTPIIRDGISERTGVPAVITAADMTHLSGVTALSRGRLPPRIVALRQDRYVRSVAAAETEVIIDEVESRLHGQGCSLQDLTRIIQFHTDLRDFLPSAQVWEHRIGGPVPISALLVKGPLVPDGASILSDCWAVKN